MRPASLLCAGLLLAAGCKVQHAASGRPPGTRSLADSLTRVEDDSAQAEGARRALRSFYARLSSRSWPQVTDAFWRGAIVTSRWVPPGSNAPRLSVSGVDEFVRLARDTEGRKAVFAVEPVTMDVRAYGDVAQAWVVFRARSGMTRNAVAVGYGVDAFHLMRHEGAWRIVSLTFTAEDPDRPLVGRAAAAAAGAPGASQR